MQFNYSYTLQRYQLCCFSCLGNDYCRLSNVFEKHPEAHKNSKFKLIGGKPIAYIILAFFFFVFILLFFSDETRAAIYISPFWFIFLFFFYKNIKRMLKSSHMNNDKMTVVISDMTINNLNILL